MQRPSSFKLRILFGLLVAFLLLSIGATWLSAELATEKFRRMDQSRHVVAEFKNLLVLLLDSETRARRYVITGDQQSLDWHQAAVTAIAGSMTALRSLTKNDASQTSRLTSMEPLLRRRLALLSEHEVSVRSIMDAVPDAVLVTDAEGRVVFLNPSASRLFGYAPADLLGKPDAQEAATALRA